MVAAIPNPFGLLVALSVRFWEGSILFVNGAIAMAEACCCEPEPDHSCFRCWHPSLEDGAACMSEESKVVVTTRPSIQFQSSGSCDDAEGFFQSAISRYNAMDLNDLKFENTGSGIIYRQWSETTFEWDGDTWRLRVQVPYRCVSAAGGNNSGWLRFTVAAVMLDEQGEPTSASQVILSLGSPSPYQINGFCEAWGDAVAGICVEIIGHPELRFERQNNTCCGAEDDGDGGVTTCEPTHAHHCTQTTDPLVHHTNCPED